MILTPGQGGEGRAEPGITDQRVLGSADVQEEMAEDGGLWGQAGLEEAVPPLRAVQCPLPFFCSTMKWCFTSFSSGGLWCVCVLSSQGISIPNRSDAAKDWEEPVLRGDQHWDVQLGHSKWQRAALQQWRCCIGW